MKTILQKLGMLIAVAYASLSAYAYDFEVDGIYYDVVSLTDFTCSVISGTEKYSGDIEIPSEVKYNNRTLSVTGIGNYAFQYCSSLISVTIPNSVTEIGEFAFYGCSSLTSVSIPDSVTEIGNYAFAWCSSLTSVTIPNSITEIGGFVFYNCSSLTSVTIPDSVTEIGNYAFSGCSSLTSVTISDSVTEIGDKAFSGCSSLVSIKLSDSLKSISYGLFEDCKSLESLSIPGSVGKIYQYDGQYTTFGNCDKLKMLRVEYSPEELVAYYLDNNTYGWRDWTDRIEVLYIDRDLYEAIPVPNLEKLELGANLKKVDVKGLKYNEELTSIESHALVPPTLPEMSNKQYVNVDVIVPAEALDAYQADKNWGKFWNLQASGVDGIKVDSKQEIIGRYDMNGRAVLEDYHGLVIVRFSDGTCKKMLNH
ncbi:MAG: leucine-rich repeat domain-containing protein [Bacteroides sp.]|nr:leucine-rich repeat domain-containing protein [Bacteroides sp.]